MHLSADETTMPRLHLVGTLTLVFVVTLALAAFYTWRNEREQRASFERVAHVITQQQQERLTTEMQSAVGYMEFLRQRTEQVLRRSLVEQVDAAMQIAQAIHARESKHRPPEQVRQLMERDRAEAARQLREAEENRRKSERLKAELSVRLEKADEKARRDAELAQHGQGPKRGPWG